MKIDENWLARASDLKNRSLAPTGPSLLGGRESIVFYRSSWPRFLLGEPVFIDLKNRSLAPTGAVVLGGRESIVFYRSSWLWRAMLEIEERLEMLPNR
jgi:hypothetical protein